MILMPGRREVVSSLPRAKFIRNGFSHPPVAEKKLKDIHKRGFSLTDDNIAEIGGWIGC
jgi:hypothetical protein